jgi:NSS family neurotransmitter:Na+ symporter
MFGNGLYILDIVDHYVTQFGMLIVWIFQAFLFLYYSKKLLKFIEDKNHWKFITRGFIKLSWMVSLVILIWLIALNLNSGILIYDSYSTSSLFYVGLLPVLWVLVLSIVLNIVENSKKKKKG